MYQSKTPYLPEAERLVLDEGKTWKQAGDALGLSKEAVRSAVRNGERWKAGERSKLQTVEHKPTERPFKETQRINADGSRESFKLLELIKGRKYTPNELLELHGFSPPESWELIECTSNVWNGMTGKKRNNELVELWQSKLRAKPKADEISLADIDRHFEAYKGLYGPEPVQFIQREGHFMAEVNIADLHLGKLCWHGDTGNDYDHKIAKRLFLGLIASICESLKGKPIEYITFVWTNDFFNSDTIEKDTTRGTPQDTDVRWQKMFNIGVEALVEGTEALAKIAPVKMFYSPSNHDEMVCYYAIKYLEAWFWGREDVEIDIDAKARKYILYGKTLIGWTHGFEEHNTKKALSIATLAWLPSIEAKQEWSESNYREMHAHHLHSEHLIEEQNGVMVRRISSPTATDTYHHRAAYVGEVRKAQTFLYDREYGLMQIINTPVEAVM